MMISQCKMLNEDQEIFFNYFFKKYSLKKYNNVNEPSVFYSLWGYNSIKKHKSFALIIWRGTDILKMEDKLKLIKKRKNIYHIAISSYISNDLKKYGIEHKFIPVVGLNMNYFEPCIMGEEIYAYIPIDNDKYYQRYGMDIIEKIKKRCAYKINIINPGQYKRENIINIYKKCFCGFRLTRHDGLPNQVIEMGLMGRKSFYNGNIPGVINWDENNIDDILENVEKESKKIGTIDYLYSKSIKDFINIDDKWLDTDFWIKK